MNNKCSFYALNYDWIFFLRHCERCAVRVQCATYRFQFIGDRCRADRFLQMRNVFYSILLKTNVHTLFSSALYENIAFVSFAIATRCFLCDCRRSLSEWYFYHPFIILLFTFVETKNIGCFGKYKICAQGNYSNSKILQIQRDQLPLLLH